MLRNLVDQYPLVWMAEVNGLLVDLRDLPREVQEIAFAKGMIPYLPADKDKAAGVPNTPYQKPGEEPTSPPAPNPGTHPRWSFRGTLECRSSSPSFERVIRLTWMRLRSSIGCVNIQHF